MSNLEKTPEKKKINVESFQLNQPNYTVISYKSMNNFRDSIIKMNPKKFKVLNATWGNFKDGTDNIYIDGFIPKNTIRGSNILFLADFLDNAATLSQLYVLVMLCESFLNSMTIVLPFFPTGTMERVDTEGTVATANCLAKLLSNLPSVGKPIRLLIYDLHTLQNRFYLGHNCLADLRSAIP
eukprot:UN31538